MPGGPEACNSFHFRALIAYGRVEDTNPIVGKGAVIARSATFLLQASLGKTTGAEVIYGSDRRGSWIGYCDATCPRATSVPVTRDRRKDRKTYFDS